MCRASGLRLLSIYAQGGIIRGRAVSVTRPDTEAETWRSGQVTASGGILVRGRSPSEIDSFFPSATQSQPRSISCTGNQVLQDKREFRNCSHWEKLPYLL